MKTVVPLLLLYFPLVLPETPPETWQEQWFEHTQLLTRHFYDSEVAIYFDPDVNKTITWLNTYLHDVWVHTKSVYGQFGNDSRLYAIFHTGKYSGGHPATYFDKVKSYRNVIDCGSPNRNAWTPGIDNELDLITHEVSHIVEGAAHGIHNSPAFPVWGDSKWAEIFTYDVYRGLGRLSDVRRWHNLLLNKADDFPKNNTFWFRDWFLPIYGNYGGSAALNRFFFLLAQHFPKAGFEYSRNMNHGEFFHFWSGAAKSDLKFLATGAFGWSQRFEKEFEQAKRDFPDVKY